MGESSKNRNSSEFQEGEPAASPPSMTPEDPYKNADEDLIPDWVRSYVSRFKQVTVGRNFNWPYFNSLNLRTVQAIQTDLTDLALIPIYALERRTERVRNWNGDQSFVLFDCLHAATARMLYYHLTIGASQTQVLEFLKEHVASSLLARGADIEALVFLDEKISFFFITKLPQPPDFYFEQALRCTPYLPKVPYGEVFPLIDLFKACHEVFHFLVQRGDELTPQYLQSASDMFDLALEENYPQTVDEARMELLERTGSLLVDQADRTAAQTQLTDIYRKNREALLAQRKGLVEELACDLFAQRAVLYWRLNERPKEQSTTWTLDEIFATIFLIANLVRLIEFYSERAADIKAGREAFDKQDLSLALHIRNYATYKFSLALVNELSGHPRMIEPLDFNRREKRIIFDEITFRLSTISSFLKMFVEYPSIAFFYMVKSLRAKLRDEQIRNLYAEIASGIAFEHKAAYTMPMIERFVSLDYFE